jgi:ubiquinone/menaquinone biosynthesis C-methylase UbiE
VSVPGRVADYDSVAARYDRRYEIHTYTGVKEALLHFIGGDGVSAILEVGCGTGHWLAEIEALLKPSPYAVADGAPASAERSAPGSAKASTERLLTGIEPSAGMIERARAAAPRARLTRGYAEALPFRDATFDRVYAINALHHFADRARFFAEARRILRPGGGLMTIGKDPHAERDEWWVYSYFPESLAIDQERFERVRTLRGELAVAGFTWTESFEADHIEALVPAADALTDGIVDRAYTSQLTVLSDEEFEAGVARIRAANEAAGGQLNLVADFRLFATVGWV